MDGRNLIKSLWILLILAVPGYLSAAQIWTDLSTVTTQTPGLNKVRADDASQHFISHRLLSVDFDALTLSISTASLVKNKGPSKQISLPMPDGVMRDFYVEESPIMQPELAKTIPSFKSFKVRGVSDVSISGRIDYGLHGFHAFIQTREGVVFIDPVSNTKTDHYYSFYKHNYISDRAGTYSCGVNTKDESQFSSIRSVKNNAIKALAKTTGNIVIYDIAVATTGEYSIAVAGGDAAITLTEVGTAISRVNEILERDLAIRLNLVSGLNLIYTDPNTDPYSGDFLTENQANIDAVIGSANYDIGHLFNTVGGGVAGLGVACNSSRKAHGETGAPSPIGDPFYIDLLAHELGHQLGANHSFNGTTSACGGGNRNAATAFEPGSGTTIMSYAGICGAEDVEFSSDATFHAGSIAEIITYTRSGTGNSCGTTLNTLNTAPVADPGSDYTIPGLTPFTLTGSADDIDADPMKYQWDEMDVGSATSSATYGTDICSNALFRSFPPVTSADPLIMDRTFPRLLTVLSGTPDKAETLPSKPRTLNFRLTVRDIIDDMNADGGVDEADMQITVDSNSGPFVVLQPNGGETLNTNLDQVIEWNAACTELAPVNCTNVNILFSTDNFANVTPLAMGALNDGEHSISNLPAVTSLTARIKIVCSDNIFFDVSDGVFATEVGTGAALTSTGNGGSNNCGTDSTGCTVTGNDQEPNDVPFQAQSITIPVTINGVVNSGTDGYDYFVFTTTGNSHTFTLSDYGLNDLDLILFGNTGTNFVTESVSESNPTETITIGLANGATYYIVVNGFETSGQDTGYTLTITSNTPAPVGGGGGGQPGLLFLIVLWVFMILRTCILKPVRVIQ